LKRIGSAQIGPVDWQIVRLLGARDEDELRDYAHRLASFDPLRFEALAHAWPSDLSLPASRLDQIERWEEVEEAKERFIDLGLTTPLSDVFGIFAGAVSELSGKPRERVLVEHA
jgi:hypothetical protein